MSCFPQSGGIGRLHTPQLQVIPQSKAPLMIRQQGWAAKTERQGLLVQGEAVCKGLCFCASARSVFLGGGSIGKLYPSDKTMYTNLFIQYLTHCGHLIRLEKSLFASDLQWNPDEQDIQGTVCTKLLDLRKGVFSPFVFLILCTVCA